MMVTTDPGMIELIIEPGIVVVMTDPGTEKWLTK